MKPEVKRAWTVALCVFDGQLGLVNIRSAATSGICPQCGGQKWRNAPYGWIECAEGCGFQVLREHAEAAKRETDRESKLAE